uniref:Uncharacterized protein n=1 Tax=Anolis carolinensis TaxID=28377 RepID=A0A803SLM2_ANOCA
KTVCGWKKANFQYTCCESQQDGSTGDCVAENDSADIQSPPSQNQMSTIAQVILNVLFI